MAWVREQAIASERTPLVGKVSADFWGYRGVAWSTQRILYGRMLGFLDRISYFFFQYRLSRTNEAEWTPFQTNYFSENLVAPGIEPNPHDL
jgi:hypothetical protein